MEVIKLVQLIIIIPIFSALLCSILSFYNKKVSKFINIFLNFSNFCISIFLALSLKEGGSFNFVFAGFKESYGIKFFLNYENSLLLVLISFIAFIFSLLLYDFIRYNKHQAPHLFSLSNLFVIANSGLVLSQDFFNLYVFIELGGICSYALLSYKGSSASFSALRYLLAGSVAATFFLLGIALFYAMTASLTLSASLNLIEFSLNNYLVLAASLFCFCALMLKSGIFPLHFWLPAAYGATHPIVATLVASLATKISLYLLFSSFGIIFYSLIENNFISILFELLISFAIIFALTRAFFETRLSYIVSYIIVAEIAYIFGGIYLGNNEGLFAASYHLIADSLITAFAFSLIYILSNSGREVYLGDLKGVLSGNLLLFIFWIYLGACFIGLPLTPSFISKIYLLKGAFLSQKYIFMSSLLLGSLIIVALFFRIIFFCTKETTIKKDLTNKNYGTRVAVYCLLAALVFYSFIPKFIPQNIFIK